jgi:hypothetical protein
VGGRFNKPDVLIERMVWDQRVGRSPNAPWHPPIAVCAGVGSTVRGGDSDAWGVA